MLGIMLRRALESAGLEQLGEQALAGEGLRPADLDRLRRADTLVLAGLADAVRERHRGAGVRVLTEEGARRSGAVLVGVRVEGEYGPTGEELLREVALARLATPAAYGVAVGLDALGLELAQASLVFGADVLVGDVRTSRTLPLLDTVDRRSEITGLVERAGRDCVWEPEAVAHAALEGRP